MASKWLAIGSCGALLVGLVACGGGDRPPGGVDGGSGADTGRPVDTGPAPGDGATPVDTGALPGDGATPADTGAPPRDGATPVDSGGASDTGTPTAAVTFVALGDTGKGNTAQREVGDQVAATCAAEGGCDFVVLLGDNIYDSGVSSPTDPLWITAFETPYTAVPGPFYAVLGNHDYGGVLGICPLCTQTGGLGNEFDRGLHQVNRSAVSAKWNMPATFYTLRQGNVGFVFLDTNSILWDDTTNGDQRAWYAGAVAALRAAGAQWIVAFGHHPYLSNGAHGNAGAYESIEVGGVPIAIPLPIMDGRNVQSFLDTVVCGTTDVYMSGHDHNRQWLNDPTALCGSELIVSGAGASNKAFGSATRNPTYWQDDTTAGFLFVRIVGDSFYGRFVNRDGTTAFERTFTRTP